MSWWRYVSNFAFMFRPPFLDSETMLDNTRTSRHWQVHIPADFLTAHFGCGTYSERLSHLVPAWADHQSLISENPVRVVADRL